VKREDLDRVVVHVTGRAADAGQVVELGFASLLLTAYPNWEAMPRDQVDQLRDAFFAGAQHLFGSIMGMLDPGSEATDRDLRRMSLIHHELEAFVVAYKQRHGITDPRVGPKPQGRQ
jgi:hypothetical protein